jgi:hypothetical protein
MSDQADITVELEWIDPPKAREYLSRLYEGQRACYAHDIGKWADDMTGGAWAVAPDAVAFDVNDRLINGQTRLNAVCTSGTKQRFIVMRNCPTSTYQIIDNPRPRTFAQLLASQGEQNVSILAGAVNALARWSRYGSLTERSGFSLPALLAVLNTHPGLRDSARIGRRVGTRYSYSKSLLTVLHYLFALVDEDEASVFFEALANQTSPEGSPGWHLQLALTKRGQTDPTRRLHERHYVALTIKAWNAHAAGAPMAALRHRVSDPLPPIFDPYGALDKIFEAKAGDL